MRAGKGGNDWYVAWLVSAAVAIVAMLAMVWAGGGNSVARTSSNGDSTHHTLSDEANIVFSLYIHNIICYAVSPYNRLVLNSNFNPSFLLSFRL